MNQPAQIASPPLVERPALALWMFRRGLRPKDGEGPLGVKAEAVRRYCLPFADPQRVVPPMPVMRRIVAWTKGECLPDSFYPASWTGGAPATSANDDASAGATP